MYTHGSPLRRISRLATPLLGCLMIFGCLLVPGCGDDEGETVVINLVPWSLGFDSTNQFYLVERAFYLSVLKFTNATVQYELTGLILPPATGGFSPWGLTVAKGTSSEILFITDVSKANDHPRLLAVSKNIAGEVGLGTLELAATEGPGAGPDPNFSDLRGVASLPLGGDVHRVFVADEDRVLAFDYNAAIAPPFTYQFEVTPSGPCSAFQAPYGVAVDPALKALYVIDRDNESLYRFTGIDGAGPGNCVAQMDDWPVAAPTDSFDDPEGVSFGKSEVGDPPVLTELIVVADSGNNRVTAFTWDGVATIFVPSDLPNNFEPFDNAAPFDLAFDLTNDLWVTYPKASAIAGPKQAATP